jgi:hypothetical protein
LVFLKFKISSRDFNNLVIKSMMHTKYKNYFFWYFQEILNHANIFFILFPFSFIFFIMFLIKNVKYVFLKKLGHMQLKYFIN